MIIPSRWFAGGMGLDDFRDEMLNDRNIISYTDFSNAKDCFPQNSISGGVGYFLRSRDTTGDCEFVSNYAYKHDVMKRDLREFKVMVRYNSAVKIIRKISYLNNSLSTIISSIAPFGIPTNSRGKEKKFNGAHILHSSNGESFISLNEIQKGKELINSYKVLISQTVAEHAGEPGKDGKFKILTSSMKVIGPKEVCTHSYIIAGNFTKKNEASNLLTYFKTQFVRFLILQGISSIHLSKSTFQFVPIQDFSEPWTDEILYKKYKLTKEEITFIESMIRPMEIENE